MQEATALARQMMSLLDLTSLSGRETSEDVRHLCGRACSPCGRVAAVCLFPRFLREARTALDRWGIRGVRLATVANFPAGEEDSARAVAEIELCLSNAAEEVDLVMPYGALLRGDSGFVRQFLRTCRKACPVLLKVILESGRLGSPDLIRTASRLAIECGADFLKTSTGRTPVHATPEAARIMLEAIAESGLPVGFKASGGLRTMADAQVYLDLAAEIMGPDWIGPGRFRFGASQLLDELLRVAAQEGEPCVGSA